MPVILSLFGERHPGALQAIEKPDELARADSDEFDEIKIAVVAGV